MYFKRVDQSWIIENSRSGFAGSLEALAHRSHYNINEMCDVLNCSQRHIYDVFVRDIGEAPQRWVDGQRMALARKKLVQGCAIQEVSDNLGYSCVVAFTRRFGRTQGVTPGKFQKLMLRSMSAEGDGEALTGKNQ